MSSGGNTLSTQQVSAPISVPVFGEMDKLCYGRIMVEVVVWYIPKNFLWLM